MRCTWHSTFTAQMRRGGAQRASGSHQVLCSVADVDAALDEARRVLRRGGSFVFIEHVGAPPNKPLLRAAQVLHRLSDARAAPSSGDKQPIVSHALHPSSACLAR